MSQPWWIGLDLRVLRHVKGVLRRRGLELAPAERRTPDAIVYMPLETQNPDGPGLGVVGSIAPVELDLIQAMLREAVIDVAQVIRERESPSIDPDGARTTFHGIIGGSPVMQELYTLLERAAPSDATVLIQGENGTGKELVAHAIHLGSERRDRKFVVTNCSAFNDNLLDSELFGHKRGAFTGAVTDKAGLFEVADRGTFFLDEIGDMSPALQVKILRVLQEGTFTPVGDTEPRHVDVRIIAATNRDLQAMVAAGTFREDLYYRIHVIHVQLPPLRERIDDIPLLIENFLARHRKTKIKRLSNECEMHMLAYPWPGNVRELENEIERLVVLAGDSPVIGPELLSARIREHAPVGGPPPADPNALPAAVEALERRMIADALHRHGGNKTRAAEDLKVSRRNLIRLVQKYGLE